MTTASPTTGERPRVLLVSPVRNEAGQIERVAAAVAAQSMPPDLWLVIDDGSTDGTLELLRRLEQEIPFLRVLEATRREDHAVADRLATAAEARAFNQALATVTLEKFTHLGKLDGDIELPPDYLERLLHEFSNDTQLGVAGGSLDELFGTRLRRVGIPEYHVHGALKLYRRDCFEAIGGIQERLAWDTIDETYARMEGYTTRSFGHLAALHLRHSASADGQLRGRARHGTCAYILHYGPAWVLLRSLKEGARRPYGLSGGAFLLGYASAAVRGTSRVDDERFRRFVRRELRRRLLAPLRRVLPSPGRRADLRAARPGRP